MFVDGFNFYYGAYRGNPLRSSPPTKWLDPVKLGNAICRQLALNGEIVRVHYCSAPALPGVGDPGQVTRQQHFFRALSGLPSVVLTLGQHTENRKFVRGVGADGRTPVGKPFPAVVREEKGSDVNLATFLVRDAALDEYDIALLLSNDSDLVNAVRIARNDFGRRVIVVSPVVNGQRGRKARVTNQLREAADQALVIDITLLGKCRLPDPAVDSEGREVRCPSEWR
jgi:uncharacterized LabA/DUF88 family protein